MRTRIFGFPKKLKRSQNYDFLLAYYAGITPMMHMIKHHRYRQHQGNIRRVEDIDNVGIAHERYRLVNRRDHDAVADNLVVEGEKRAFDLHVDSEKLILRLKREFAFCIANHRISLIVIEARKQTEHTFFNAYDFVVLHVVHAVFSWEREVALHDERVIAEFVFYEVLSRNTQKFLVDNESHNFLLKKLHIIKRLPYFFKESA